MRYSIDRLKSFAFRSIRDMYRGRDGFALLEGVLIIFILGFIFTTIFVGKELVERAKVRSLAEEVRDLKERISNFESVYDYKPGDFPNASDFWGINSCGGMVYGANGNGNGLIEYIKSDVRPNRHDAVVESYVAWCHMALASMGPYINMLNELDSEPLAGVNLPRTKIGGVFHLTSDASGLFGTVGNILVIGMPNIDMSHPKSLLTPLQAYKLDKLEDDGDPSKGSVRAASGSDVIGGKCIEDGKYNLKVKEKVCIMAFVLDERPEVRESAEADID